MTTSMQKSFLIKERNFKEISEGKGYLEYHLLDESGNTRTVTATAKTGKFRELSNIKAVYKREQPLVKALTKASVNDTVFVDFTKFNKKNPRPKLSESRSRSYRGAYNGSSSHTHTFDTNHMLRLFGIAIIGFISLLMIKIFF